MLDNVDLGWGPMEPWSPQLLGIDERWQALYAAWASGVCDAVGLARVVRADRGRVWVIPAKSGEDHTGEPAPQPARVAASCVPVPAVGDWVALRVPPDPEVATVLPRRTEVVRAAGDGTSGEQVLAANVDVGLIVEPAVPQPRPGRVERLAALVWRAGARPLVVLSKADLAADPAALADMLRAECHLEEVVTLNAPGGVGLGELRDLMGSASTFVVLGPSGAGKSTLINALAGREVLSTGEVRAGDAKGRHTSVRREAVSIPGVGVMIDTPGLRTVAVVGDEDSLDATFADIAALAGQCRFGDCAHAGEPGCAVADAVAAGALSARRLESYRKLLREAAWHEQRHDALAGARARARGRQMRAHQLQAMRVKGRRI